MACDPITAITSSIPPQTDYLTYLTILESHLSPEILPALDEILQDAVLTQNIGWDLIQLLLPLSGAEPCLNTIARIGNPREVVLKVTEALRSLSLDDAGESDGGDGVVEEGPRRRDEQVTTGPPAPSDLDKFCTLLSLLSTLHPRIKTKYPSRFLSTSLTAAMSSYQPSSRATSSVVSFVHALSGTKRPPLPHRKPTMVASSNGATAVAPSAPDPEATAEEPQEEAIQKKLLQSFITHVLEEYVNANRMEWSARLQEHFEPTKIVPGRKTFGEAFKQDPQLQERDAIMGQLAALARDLGLSSFEVLFRAMFSDMQTPQLDGLPSSPDDIPLSPVGCLFLVAYLVFSSILFDTNFFLPPMSIYPGHSELAKQFLGTHGPATVGSEEESVIDAVLSIGLWLERSEKIFSGPLEDEDFLRHLQTLSLLSANHSSPTTRYIAHSLTSSILHAHPKDSSRLTFITDTLENCPYESLKACAVAWLKEEIIKSVRYQPQSHFSTVAFSSAKPFLFPDLSLLVNASDRDALEEIKRDFSFHMAVLNFLYFLSGRAYRHVVSKEVLPIVVYAYLDPLGVVLGRLQNSISLGGEMYGTLDNDEVETALAEIELLGNRLHLCVDNMEIPEGGDSDSGGAEVNSMDEGGAEERGWEEGYVEELTVEDFIEPARCGIELACRYK